MIRWIVVVLTMVVAAPALAETSWPARPVTIVVGESEVNVLAQVLADGLSAQFTQPPFPVLIDRHPGAVGANAASIVASSIHDGHDLLVSTGFVLAQPNPDRALRVDELRPISVLAGLPYVLATGSKSAYRTVADVAAASRAGQLRLAGEAIDGKPGHGSLALSAFGARNGLALAAGFSYSMNFIITNLAQNQFDVSLVGLNEVIVSSFAQNNLRQLAILADKRSPFSPETPTAKELGYESPDLTSWIVLSVPAKTPSPIRNRISALAGQALSRPEAVTKLGRLAFFAVGSNEAEAIKMVDSQRELFAAAPRSPIAVRSTPPQQPSSPATILTAPSPVVVSPAPSSVSTVEQWRQRSAALTPSERRSAGDLFRSGFDALKAGDGAKAATAFGAGLALDPGNGSAHYYRGEALLLSGRAREAVSEWRAARDLAPGSQEGQQAIDRLRLNGQ